MPDLERRAAKESHTPTAPGKHERFGQRGTIPPVPSVVIEGWRFLPHSYSLWAMYLALDLLDRPGFQVYFRDLPRHDARFVSSKGVLSPEQEAHIEAIPPPPEGLIPELVVRISFPYDLSPASAKQTVVLATSEYGVVPNNFVAGGESIAAAAARTGVRIGTPTRWSRDGFLRSGVRAKQLFIAPNGIDPRVFHPADDATRAVLRRELGWDGSFVLLHNSSLGWNKNIEMMLEGLLALWDEFPQLILVLKGMDALYDSARAVERISNAVPEEIRRRLVQRVRYIGTSLSMEQVARLYQAADAYVCPYLAEGFNMPALEAAACGIPAICTAGGSTDDFMTGEFAVKVASDVTLHSTTGGRALMPRFESYLAALRRVIRDETFRRKARTAGPAHAHGGWTWRHAADRLLAETGLK
jgi:glycosyltransferase involved in cell wall biosynthesis